MELFLESLKKIGTDEKTLAHLRWLAAQDSATVMDIMHGLQNYTLDDALTQLGTEKNFWSNSEQVMTEILGAYARENIIALNEEVSIKLHDITLEAYYDTEYHSITASYELMLNGVIVYKAYSVTLKVKYSQNPALQSAESILKAFADSALMHINMNVYNAVNEPLILALTFEKAQRDLENLGKVFKSLDRALVSTMTSSVVLFIKQYLKRPMDGFDDKLNALCDSYNKTVRDTGRLIRGENYICYYAPDQYGQWAVFVAEDGALYKKIDPKHGRYKAITAEADSNIALKQDAELSRVIKIYKSMP